MIRVYNDEFYKNKAKKISFEKKYVELICKHARKVNTKDTLASTDVVSLYSRITTSIKSFHTLHNNIFKCLPQSFEELLSLSPSKMAKIYYILSIQTNDCIKNDIVQLFFYTFYQWGKKNYKPDFVEKNILLDYDFFYKDISSYILDAKNSDIFSFTTCFYCNSAYINMYYNKSNIERHKFDIEHFIPKDKIKICPLFSLSLYNFVPSCHFCNSSIKKSNVYFNDSSLYEITKLFPTNKDYNFDKELKFKITPNNFKFINNQDFYYADHVKDFNIELKPEGNNYKIYKKESVFFEIIERYECHKKEFLSYIDKRRKYNESYFDLYEKKCSSAESNNLREAIFNTKLRKDTSPIFYKIYNDIDHDIY